MKRKRIIGCRYCGGELTGKVEYKEKKARYGLYCKQCKEWSIQDTKKLEYYNTEIDKETYKIFLTGKENEKQMDHIAEAAKISVYEARVYLKEEGEIFLYEGKAKEVFAQAIHIMRQGFLFRIYPEFPYKMIEEMSEEEREKITMRLAKVLGMID